MKYWFEIIVGAVIIYIVLTGGWVVWQLTTKPLSPLP